jgi:hypothetical protein
MAFFSFFLSLSLLAFWPHQPLTLYTVALAPVELYTHFESISYILTIVASCYSSQRYSSHLRILAGSTSPYLFEEYVWMIFFP